MLSWFAMQRRQSSTHKTEPTPAVGIGGSVWDSNPSLWAWRCLHKSSHAV